MKQIKFEELEERFEMATGGSCERKCSGGDGDGGGSGGGGPKFEIPTHTNNLHKRNNGICIFHRYRFHSPKI